MKPCCQRLHSSFSIRKRWIALLLQITRCQCFIFSLLQGRRQNELEMCTKMSEHWQIRITPKSRLHDIYEQETDKSSNLKVLYDFDSGIVLADELGVLTVLDQDVVNQFGNLWKFGFSLHLQGHKRCCKDISDDHLQGHQRCCERGSINSI